MNEEFLKRIQEYIPEEYEDFLKSLDEPLKRGLRLNTKKLEKSKFQEKFSYPKEDSFFYPDSYFVYDALGNHPWHIGGAYYLQEPSASGVVGVLDVQADDLVLDLCAAPGSKSSQIAQKLENGLLICNELDPKRAGVLAGNLERMGFENTIVTNMDASLFCSQFKETFDKILVDAPCSGEGMIKKHTKAIDEWSLANIETCSIRQTKILDSAYEALKEGGTLVYSTCTYAKEENEEKIARFLKDHEDMELVDVNVDYGRAGLKTEGMDASKVRRIFPMDQGEGQFLAKMIKKSGSKKNLPAAKEAPLPQPAKEFIQKYLPGIFSHYQVIKKEGKELVFGMNHPFVKVKKGTVIRQGCFLGEVIKKRFEPSQGLFLNTHIKEMKLPLVSVNLQQADEFMHGLPLNIPCPKGYAGLSYDGVVFAYGKSDGKQIKNKVPKGLRLLPNSHLIGNASPVNNAE